jgi:hypothetical protein
MQKKNWIKGLLAGLVAMTGQTAVAGPDVIVGDLYDPRNYGVVGTAPNEIYAYSIGTISCNIAAASPGVFKTWLPGYTNVQDNALMWVDSNDPIAGKTHPVISQNMYKLSNGRFTQIGQAWLKHGFCALQGTLCSTCTGGGNCDYLYPGCSDPYDGGLNGSQSGLGPKHEVNAATGVFPYPFINGGSGAGAAFKRLQAKKSELQDASATFYVSSLYMQVEDRGGAGGYGVAASYNSQSYRRVIISQSTFAMSLADTTQRQKPGIQAWKDADTAGVTLTNVDIPSDGRFIVGVKVITLAGGIYRYEYAIQNLHSDKSGGSFSVPVPAASTVTNIGFHDVDYHSGEPYNNLDWAGVFSGGTVTWTCPTAYNAGNDVGNALRWDTLYNFWFECNQAPAAGTATLGLYKGGGTVAVSTTVPGTGGALPNDNCANAIIVGNGLTTFNTSTATTDGPNECVTAADLGIIGKDVWFLWTNGNCNGTATITTCGSAFDTKLAVYNNGACPSAPLTNIACNDDSATCAPGSLQSVVTFTATANATYRIRVGGYDGDGNGAGVPLSGAANLNITPPTGCVANDTCAQAATASNGANNFDSSSAVTDGLAECASAGGYTNFGRDIWYRWTNGPNAGTATINTCGSTFDTKIALYGGSCPTLANQALACNDNDAACANGGSQIQFSATAGGVYYIRVGGVTSALGGVGVLNITAPAPVAPANNACANAIAMGDGITYTGDTTNASDDGSASCGAATNSADVWYKYTPAVSGTWNVNTCGTTPFDTVISVFTTCGGAEVACNDDNANGGNNACGGGLASGLNVAMTAGTTYLIRVAGYNNTVGAFQVRVVGGGGCETPANNDCANRPGFAASTPFNTCGATTDGVAFTWNSVSTQIHNDIWLNYAANAGNGTVTLTTCGATFNSRMAVYATGTCGGVSQATFVTAGDSECGDDASVTFSVVNGNSYTVRIGGAAAGNTGSGTLSVTFTPAPSCVADFDNDSDYGNGRTPDGGVDINDLLSYLGAFEDGHVSADVANGSGQNIPDGGVDVNDLIYFLIRFEQGC